MHAFQFEEKYKTDTKILEQKRFFDGTIIRESKWKGKYCFGAVL